MEPHPLARRTREPRPLVQAGQIGPAPLAGAIKTLGPGRQIVSQDSPDGVSRIGGQAGTQAPTLRPYPVKPGKPGRKHYPQSPCRIFAAARFIGRVGSGTQIIVFGAAGTARPAPHPQHHRPSGSLEGSR